MPRINAVLTSAAKSLANSESPLLDAEVLLCKVLGKPRSYLRAWPDKRLETDETAAFETLLAKRQTGIPIAYITGSREFWSRNFTVTPDVLIPRPDTECLVELSLQLIPANQPARIIDLGTGSGIIAVTLAAERPHAEVCATDFSLAALHVAQYNARIYQTDISFYQSNWFVDVPASKFDLVVSNPPYIPADDEHLRAGDLRFEPQQALVAAGQGLGDIKAIAESARYYLDTGGHLLIEHGYNQEHHVQAIFKHYGYHRVQTYQDLSGQPRVTLGCISP
ncbi:MAG: peptide chain release factor N(5)-glutamine methyltransferase [Methylovulum sp.]|nr:MAG: peptide chain release factor N(5)-glutamine methyltransferase [Methylovulum sp.]